ncbi:MAG: Wadjet anti-phage system protein JetD domain-containing protein [Gallionella sp.]
MGKWTTPADLRVQLQKSWDKGEWLRSLVTGQAIFPKKLSLKTPTSEEMTYDFAAVRAWVKELDALPHCRVVRREFKHRTLGNNAIPDEIWLDNPEQAGAWLGKKREVARFQNLLDAMAVQQPNLLNWLAKNPLKALALADDWQRLLDFVAWRQTHLHPDIYLRQVDLPSIDTKWIEQHRGVLAVWLDATLPAEQIDPAATGAKQFAARYGFRDKLEQVRFRVLDGAPWLFGCIVQDITLDAASFAQLNCPVSQVFIVENEITYLAFPPVKNSWVIFGAGYGFEMLRHAQWLSRCRVHYWGDLDTHGFAILDQLRSHFPHVESLLMDRATLLKFQCFWGAESTPTQRDLPRLTAAESLLYDDLRWHRLQVNLRLEQERIGFKWLKAALADLA